MQRKKQINRQLHGTTFKREKAYLYSIISESIGIPKRQVECIVNHFFGRAGLQANIRKCESVRIRNFGTIYFHSTMVKAYKKKRKEVEEYNCRGKQLKYWRKKHQLFFNEK